MNFELFIHIMVWIVLAYSIFQLIARTFGLAHFVHNREYYKLREALGVGPKVKYSYGVWPYVFVTAAVALYCM